MSVTCMLAFAALGQNLDCTRVRSLSNLVICIEHVIQSWMLVEIDQGLGR